MLNNSTKISFSFICFSLLCFCFFFLFLRLGIWQVHRLSWKENLIKTVSSRITQPPVALESKASWQKDSSLASENLAYLPVSFQGKFISNKAIYVTTLRDDTMGYWLIMPLEQKDGTIILVNRGFVPMDLRNSTKLRPASLEDSQGRLYGIIRTSENKYSLFYKNNPAKNKWYKRDVRAMAESLKLDPNKVAPFFIDESAVKDSQYQYPMGGLTKISFPNSHLSYAITWFTLAAGTLAAILFLFQQQFLKKSN